MRKSLLSIFLAAILLLCLVPNSAEADEEIYEINHLPITIHLDGRFLPTDMNPIIKDGRTLVPIRVISESLGAEVYWNGDSNEVHVMSNGKDLGFVIGQKSYTLNGANRESDIAAQVIGGRTLVPLRIIAETLDTEVSWNQHMRDVDIRSHSPSATVQAPPNVQNERVQWLIDKFYVQNSETDPIVGNWEMHAEGMNVWLSVSDIGNDFYEMIAIYDYTQYDKPVLVEVLSLINNYQPSLADYTFGFMETTYHKGPGNDMPDGKYFDIYILKDKDTLILDRSVLLDEDLGEEMVTNLNLPFTRF